MAVSREKQLEQAKAALRAKRDLKKLDVYPGPRGSDTVRYGVRRKGRHLYWYIGEFQTWPQPDRPELSITGPVQCEEVPVFRTEREANDFLQEVRAQ